MHCDELRIPTRAVSLMWSQRSVDTFLGLPFNIASYGLLLSIIGEIVNMVPDQLIGNLGDTHLYLNHIEQAKEQIGREFTDEELEEAYPELKRLREISAAEINKQNYANAAEARQLVRDLLETILQQSRTPFPLPKLIMNTEFWNPGTDEGCGMGPGTYTSSMNGLIDSFEIGDFMLEDYKAHPHIPAPLSN
jgi:thymidylate synthase